MTEASEPQEPAMVMERIGPAEIHAPIGQCMGAQVYEGSTASDEDVMVWSWPSDQVGGAAIPRLLAIIEGLEANAPSCLAPVLHGSLTADQAVLVFLKPPGETLETRASAEPLSPLRALAGCRELVQAIEEAKTRGIRTVRWSPALIGCPDDEESSWLLMAPGVHALPSDSIPVPSSLEEAAAIAPELATGEVTLENLEDDELVPLESYAIGATLFYALTGTLPLEAESAGAYRRLQGEEAARDLATLVESAGRYPQLLDLVRTCLSRQPEERPQSHVELMDALDTCVREAKRMASDVAFLPVRFSDSVANLSKPPPREDTIETGGEHRSQIIVFILLVSLLLFVLLFQVTGNAATPPETEPTPGAEGRSHLHCVSGQAEFH